MSNSMHIRSQSGRIFDLQAPLARRRGAVLYLLMSYLTVACDKGKRTRNPEWWIWLTTWIDSYEGDLCGDLSKIFQCTMFDETPLTAFEQGSEESGWMKREDMIVICRKLVHSKPDFSKYRCPPLSENDAGIEIDLKAWLYTLQADVPTGESVRIVAL